MMSFMLEPLGILFIQAILAFLDFVETPRTQKLDDDRPGLAFRLRVRLLARGLQRNLCRFHI